MAYLVKRTQYRGRKMRVGTMTTYLNDDGHRLLCVMAGYCPECTHKVYFTLDEAKDFARRYARHQKKPRYRLLVWLLRKLTQTDHYDAELERRIQQKERHTESLLVKY